MANRYQRSNQKLYFKGQTIKSYGKEKKDKKTKSDPQSTTQKTKDWATRHPVKTGE